MRDIAEEVTAIFALSYPLTKHNLTIGGFNVMLMGQNPYPHVRVVYHTSPSVRVRMRSTKGPLIHEWPIGYEPTARDIIDRSTALLYQGFAQEAQTALGIQRYYLYEMEPEDVQAPETDSTEG